MTEAGSENKIANLSIDAKDNYNIKKGIICILAAGMGFVLMSLCVRLSGDLPIAEKAFFRNIVAAALAVALLLKNNELGEFKKLNRETIPPLAARCIAGTAGIFLNFWAIDHISLADANMLNKMSPIFAMIFAAILLKDIPKRGDVICIVTAFFGVLFVVKPGSSLFQVGTVIGLLGGLGAGLAYSCVRILGVHHVRSEVIVATFSIFSTLCSLPFIFMNPQPMTLNQLIILIIAGCGGAAGQLFITAAYTYAPPKEISIYDYSQVIYAAILAFFIWGELPDKYSLLGYVIIIGAAAVHWKRQLKDSTSK